MSKIKRAFSLLFPLLKAVLAFPVGRLCYKSKRIWLVGERPDQAQDNGLHFFRYMKRCHPEKQAYYVIKKGSPRVEELKSIGEIIYYGSFRHWCVLFGSEALVSTHLWSLIPTEIWARRIIVKHRPQWQKHVFLQHGVISADIPTLYKERTDLDLFICGAKPEYDYVKEHFHYVGNEVVYTGLARYDALHDFTVKKQILIMPTWRTWLENLGDELKDSEYFQQWNQVISDGSFIQAAEKAGYRILLYPHPHMQRHRALFSAGSDNVIIADERDYDIQTLLKESALLITDFSSVFFDFAYMRKPMLFFHFDKERHAAEHYHKGYFDYERDGFGKETFTAPALIEAVKEMLAQGVVLSEDYSRRIDRFFPLYDKNNCERIYQEIEKICKD